MKQFFLLLLLVLFGAVPSLAQNTEADLGETARIEGSDDTEATLHHHLGIMSVFESETRRNAAVLNQSGFANEAHLQQSHSGGELSPNAAYIYQNGVANSADLMQEGMGNTTVVRQRGNMNTIESELLGDNNTALIHQYGNRNTVLQHLEGDGLTDYLLQAGNGNLIEHIGFGSGPNPLVITQTGNGKQLRIIEHP